jgi:WD40 repeat protein
VIIDLSMITSAIVAMGVEATWEKVKRHEAVIKLLEHFKLDPINPPTDFDGIYAYTLIEYSSGRPEPIVNFFRNKFVREAFWQSFYKNDPLILNKEAEGIIQWNEETGKLGHIDYDPRREFAAFSAVFQEIVSRTRTPADVKRDQKLDDIREDIHQKTGEILEHLKRFDALNELRVEIARLAEVQKVAPSPSADIELRVRGLLEAMGYRINDAGSTGVDLYFLCDIKSGAKISHEVVHFVDREPTDDDIIQLDEALIRHNAKEGILLVRESLPASVRDLVHEYNRIQCYTLNEFIDLLADFRPYLQRMIENHEEGEIPQFYVPLSIQSEPEEEQALPNFSHLETFIETWLKKPEHNHVSIMGDFGSGKTWFCKYYSYFAAKRYLSDPMKYRIPILITLRDYSRAYDIEQLITDVIVNRFKIGLAAGYKTFVQLNEAGRLLLIFDGFDEMERRVSDYRTTVDNFWELAKVVSPLSKVILTCRTAYFRHIREEKETLIPRRSQISLNAGDLVIDLRNRKGFELIRLLDFTDEDIQLAIQKRIPHGWQRIYEKIQALPNLRDLAVRPVLLDMIVKTLPQFSDALRVNQATLYETYVDTLLQNRKSDDTDFIPPKDRRFFMEELAWEMYQTQKLTIPFSEFPERVIKHFHLQNDPEQAAFLERDVRTQSYLVRDKDGNYRFGHKSFLEYFVAHKMADTISRSDYDITRAIEVWKSKSLTYETLDFLVHMVTDSAPLWHMIEATRNKTMIDVGYAGGNAATLLQLLGESFVQADLSQTVLAGADLQNRDLTRAVLRRASLRLVNLSGCTLVQTDVREADLTNIRIEEMGSVEAVMFVPSGEMIVSGSADGIVRLWNWMTAEQIGRFVGGSHITSICFSPDGRVILAGVGQHGHDGYIKMWNVKNEELVGTFVGHTKPIWDISFCPGQQRFASGAHDGSVRIWDLDSHTQVGIIHKRERGIWEICYSPDGAYIAVAGGSELEIYDAQTYMPVWIAPEKTIEFRSVKYSNTNLLAYTTREGHIIVRGATDKKFLCGMKGPYPGPNCIAFSPDGDRLAMGSNGTEAKIQIWDIHSGKLENELSTGVDGYIGRIHWNAQNYLAGGFSDGTVRVWNLDPNRFAFLHCLIKLEARIQCRDMRIAGALGLDIPAPDEKGTLRNWFIARGARE